MSNEEKGTLPVGWVAERLATLRQHLDMIGEWPEKAESLWLDLAQSGPDYPDEGNEVLISFVVSDALQGVDITQRYPDFYRKMLGNPELFEAFIETIEVLEADRAGTLEEFPVSEFTPPIPAEIMPQPVVEESRFGRWVVVWRQTAERLEGIFRLTGPSLAAGYRSSSGLLEESSTSLIRGQATVAGQNLGVLLTADRTDNPGVLRLNLLVAELGWSNAGIAAGSLQANLRWGHYDQTGVINEEGQVELPPLFLEAVLDESDRSLVGDLQLRLELLDNDV